MTLKEFAEKSSRVFAKLAIVGTKSGKEVGVDVEFTSYFAVDKDGDDNFGFSFEGASEVAGIGVDVVDDDRFAGGSSSAADALIERDARVRGHRALERAEDEDVTVCLFFQHVKPDPVVAGEFFVEKSDDAFHERVGRGGRVRQSVEVWDQVESFGVCSGHGE